MVILHTTLSQLSGNDAGKMFGFGTFSAHLGNLTKNFLYLVFHYFNRMFPKSSNVVTIHFNFGNVLETFFNWFDIGSVLI
jgi:hypothetical protein